jgi:hypothetical protein
VLSTRRAKNWRRGPSKASRVSTAALLALSVGLVAGAGYLWWLNSGASREIDAATLCPEDQRVSDVTVLLLDMSDSLGEAQSAKLQNDLVRIQQDIPRFGLIALYAVDGGTSAFIRPVLELCNPGDGADLNALYQNPILAKQRWHKEFASKLNSELSKLLELPSTSTSPILEALQAAAVQTFDAPKNDHAHKRLFIVSDLMQNVPTKMNQYSGILPFATFKSSPYYNEVRTNLTNVEVTIFYVVRPQTSQKWPEHRLFWEHYFTAQGARVERIEPLYGVQ